MQKGSIYQRSNGLFQGTVQFNGIKKTFYSRSKNDLQDKMNDWYYEMKYSNVSNDNVVTLSNYIKTYLFTYKYGFIRQQSFDRLESILNCHFVGSSIDIPIYKIDDVLVQQFLNDKALNCNLSQSSLKKIFQMIRSVLQYAYRKGDIAIDYGSMLVCPKSRIATKIVENYSDIELNTLEDSIRCVLLGDDKRLKRLYRYSPMYLFIAESGLRAGEVLALEWSNVDFDNNTVYICQSIEHVSNREDGKKYIDVIGKLKTENSYRTIPLNNKARECLLYMRSISTGNFVIDNGKGSFLLLRSFEQTFSRICDNVGISCKGLHALRHTFATRLIDCGVTPKVVSQLLGHSSVVFTLNRYVHVDDDVLRDGVLALQQRTELRTELRTTKKECLQTLVNTTFNDKQLVGESNPQADV